MPHAGLLRLYRDLLGLRAHLPALRQRQHELWDVAPIGESAVVLRDGGHTR